MADLRGEKALLNRDLMAIYTDKQITRNSKGEMTGVYLDVQIDQSCMDAFDIADGKAQKNPSIETHDAKDGKHKSHTVWYSKKQFDMMAECCSGPVTVDGKHAIAFNGNLSPTRDPKTGKTRMIVLCPKVPDGPVTPEESAKINAYNEKNMLKPSYSGVFDAQLLTNQMLVTRMARDRKFMVQELGDIVPELEAEYNEMFPPGRAEPMPKPDSHETWKAKREVFLAEHDAEVKARWEKEGRSGYTLEHPEDFVVDSIMADPNITRFSTDEERHADKQSVEDAVAHMKSFTAIDSSLVADKDQWEQVRREHDGYMIVDFNDGTMSVDRDFRDGEFNGKYFNPIYNEPMSYDSSAELTAERIEKAKSEGRIICYYDSLERQFANEQKKTLDLTGPQQDMNKTAQMFTQSSVALEPRSVSGMLKDSKMSTGMPLIAVWKSSDNRFDKAGNLTGTYLDVQLDQSTLTHEDVLQGKGYSSPSISFTTEKDPKMSPNKVFYTAKQLDMIEQVGKAAQLEDGTYGVSFSANVYAKTNEHTGQATSIVLMPKDVPENASLEDRAVIEGYNQYNQLRGSIHPVFKQEDLKRQFDVTQDIRANTLVNDKHGKDFETSSEPKVENQVQNDDVVDFT